MIFIDTHTHLYLEQFDKDRHEAVQRAINAGVKSMLLPNIDSTSVDPMLGLENEFPRHCFAMMGLHPTSVKQNWREEIAMVEEHLRNRKFYAVGEVGLDFYWDQTFRKEQEIVFRRQIELSIFYNLPLVIHSRKALDEIIQIIEEMKNHKLKGVFHCFPGSLEQARRLAKLGFKLGIGGVITYKNSTLGNIVNEIGLEHILLETDAPFICPAPFRGRRNESAYVPIIAKKVAEVFQIDIETVAAITTQNALDLFSSLPRSE